jgi:hypothetical protein
MIDYVTTGTLARHIVATILVTASIAKVFNFRGFVKAVAPLAFGAKHSPFAAPAAVVIVVAESVVGVLMFRNVPAAGLVGAAMLGVFAIIVAAALLRTGGPVKCGCGGADSLATWASVCRNLGLLSLAVSGSGTAVPAWTLIGMMLLLSSLIGPMILGAKKDPSRQDAVAG